ncbi:hypothetical protein IJ765_00395 [Candidatus Saccharibacteria bacterium]|nr:hypothetical protein [Candidatus Saccharibacteria bacterium]
MSRRNRNPYNRTPFEEHDQEVMGQGNNRGPEGRSEEEMKCYAEMFGNPDKPQQPKSDPADEPKDDKSADSNPTPAPASTKANDSKADEAKDAKQQPDLGAKTDASTEDKPSEEANKAKTDSAEPKTEPKDDKPADSNPTPAPTGADSSEADKAKDAKAEKPDGDKGISAPAPDGNKGVSAPAPEQPPAREPRETTEPINSSATLNIAPFADDIQVLANELRDSDSMIESVHDANRIDVRLERIAIQVCAGDEKLATRVRKLAKNYKPVTYERKMFWFTRGEYGLKNPASPAYKTKEEAKLSFGKDMLDFLEENGSDTELLVIQEEGYADADGNWVCSLYDGMPTAAKPRINVSAELVHNAKRYFNKLHDDHTVAPQLGDLFVQIVGTDSERVKRMELQIEENRKARLPKMRFGYWVDHIDQPSLTKEEAMALAYREAMSKLTPKQARLLELTGGKLKIAPVKISVYEELPGGRLGKRVPDELAREFMKDKGYKPTNG